ncbi:MAG TPA: glutamate racemase [Rhodocyclaceae bacterium]|nr:glutamate racemase [Rhodocyclaceae bacterium]
MKSLAAAAIPTPPDAPAGAGPVAVFDSGLGGLTVLRALRLRLPAEDFFYFADTHHLPYGDKPEAFLRERGRKVAMALADRGCKALVVACNTATAAAAEVIRESVDIPVVALEPGVKPAAAATRRGVIGVMATTRTLASERFSRLVREHAAHVRVIARACPGLADAIEVHGPESGEVAALLDDYVASLAEADQVVLGCTHYPWVREAIAARLPEAALIDTGEAVARQLERILRGNGGLGGHGRLAVATSGNPVAVRETVARLWGSPLPVEHWNI